MPSDQVSLFPAHDVTIVTQCSVNHLFRIPHLAVRWNGPISVAVFTHDDVFQLTVHTILHLHSCFQNIYNHVTFHLVLPVNRTPMKIENILRLEEMNVKCSKTVLDKNWMKWSKHNYDIYGLDFPQNVLRNLAINHVLTKYVLLLDVDMLPSARLSHQFSSMLHRMQSSSAGRLSVANFSKTAFVLPAFEVKMYVPTNFSFSSYFPNLVLPHTRQDLVKFWERAAARPFYIELCKKCQSPTDYHRWRYLSPEMELSVGYRVDWIDPWEPFYIAASSLPLYDERFKQYGFNRISQVSCLSFMQLDIINFDMNAMHICNGNIFEIFLAAFAGVVLHHVLNKQSHIHNATDVWFMFKVCEMHVAGYTFAVLDNAFIIHLGFKSQGDFHTSKAVEQTVNRKLFRRFKEELKVKYSASRNRC